MTTMPKKNQKKILVGGVLLLALVVYGIIFFLRPSLSEYGLVTEEIMFGQNTLKVEIADTDSSRAKGLMMRTFLPDGHGMLFVWPEEAPRTMWMKDTFIPLDMIFMDGQGKIVAIIPNAVPHDLSPLAGDRPARYVLEVPAGYAARLQMAVGQTLSLP